MASTTGHAVVRGRRRRAAGFRRHARHSVRLRRRVRLAGGLGHPADVRDDLDFESEVLPVLISQLTAPGGAAKFEFIRLVAGVPRGRSGRSRSGSSPPRAAPSSNAAPAARSCRTLDHTYSMSPADRAFLAGLGITGAQVDGWHRDHGWQPVLRADVLAALPGEVRGLHRQAQEAGADVAHPSGRTRAARAHLRVHETVAAAGPSALVAEAWTSGVGHCNFTAEQIVTAVDAMNVWITDGVPPESFPAELGFIDFDPPDWPQP